MNKNVVSCLFQFNSIKISAIQFFVTIKYNKFHKSQPTNKLQLTSYTEFTTQNKFNIFT